jgi:hypothetical protein
LPFVFGWLTTSHSIMSPSGFVFLLLDPTATGSFKSFWWCHQTPHPNPPPQGGREYEMPAGARLIASSTVLGLALPRSLSIRQGKPYTTESTQSRHVNTRIRPERKSGSIARRKLEEISKFCGFFLGLTLISQITGKIGIIPLTGFLGCGITPPRLLTFLDRPPSLILTSNIRTIPKPREAADALSGGRHVEAPDSCQSLREFSQERPLPGKSAVHPRSDERRSRWEASERSRSSWP